MTRLRLYSQAVKDPELISEVGVNVFQMGIILIS